MSKKFLSPVNLTNGATLPTSGSTGDLFFKSDDFKIYVHDGANWVVAQGSGGTGSTWQGAWDSMATYSPGDAVSFEGSSYVYISAIDGNSNPATTPVDWGILAEQGSPGIVWQGTWSSMNYYNVNDAVQYNGSAYINTSAGMSSTPPAALMGWSLLASKGTDGSAGINWRGEYDPMASYLSLDAVSYLGSSYVYKGIAFGNSTPEEGSSDWDVLAGGSTGGGGASVTVSDTAPATPSSGNLWYNSAIGISFIYYDSFWVEMSPAITGPAGPTGVIVSETAPTNTDQLWADPNATGSYIVPANGSKGQVLAKVTDASYDTGWVTPQGSGNVILNSDFNINQRNFTSTTANGTYGLDRWNCASDGVGFTYSAQAFTPGTAPVSGYEAKNFARIVTSGQTSTSTYSLLQQPIEDVKTLAGQTVTLSFWAKAASGTPKVAVEFYRWYGSGGSPSADEMLPVGFVTLSTSWARYTLTYAMPSISGKTVGTSLPGSLNLGFWVSAGSTFNTRASNIGIQSNSFDFWGVQLEGSSFATPFRRNSPSLQAELAACQRYYYRRGGAAYETLATGINVNTLTSRFFFQPPVTMRSTPHSIDWKANLGTYDDVAATTYPLLTPVFDYQGTGNYHSIQMNSSSTLVAGRQVRLIANGDPTAYIGFSAEL